MDQITKLVLAVIVVVAVGGFLALIVMVDVPPTVHDILLVAAGTLFSNFTSVYQYFFGSSSGSSAKDKTITDLTTKP